ncbi:unnamed protein product [Moneuplotes crassus]|uniref:Uncharacterized protein n=1 Tax=Euplotes crassus TaxID=5936 RepID=A0AAD1XQP4_EUPCR|nr:unnamed protein product [Moneuplotes crassus]
MNAIFHCDVCNIEIYDATGLCEYHTYTKFMDKYQEELSKNLRAWKKSIQADLVGKCHTNTGETEQLLLKSEEALDRIILATGSEIIDKQRAYYRQEYFYVNTDFKLFLAKFKALRLPKLERLYISKNPNESRRIYSNYFNPMKHQLKSLTFVSNTPTSKLGWYLPLIAQDAFKAKTLTLLRYIISIAQFKRILVACNSIESLVLYNCRINGNFNSESDLSLCKQGHKGQTTDKLSLVNCDIQDGEEALEHFISKLSPETEVNFYSRN